MDVQVYNDAIPEPLLLPLRSGVWAVLVVFPLQTEPCFIAIACAAVPALASAHPSAMWVPRSSLDAWLASAGQADHLRGIGEHVVAYVYQRLMQARLPKECVGAEWWCQCREGSGMAFHVDKDENRMRRDGVLRTPLVSCIIYLDGDSDSAICKRRTDGSCPVVCAAAG